MRIFVGYCRWAHVIMSFNRVTIEFSMEEINFRFTGYCRWVRVQSKPYEPDQTTIKSKIRGQREFI